jgi:hypothetical protein
MSLVGEQENAEVQTERGGFTRLRPSSFGPVLVKLSPIWLISFAFLAGLGTAEPRPVETWPEIAVFAFFNLLIPYTLGFFLFWLVSDVTYNEQTITARNPNGLKRTLRWEDVRHVQAKNMLGIRSIRLLGPKKEDRLVLLKGLEDWPRLAPLIEEKLSDRPNLHQRFNDAAKRLKITKSLTPSASNTR